MSTPQPVETAMPDGAVIRGEVTAGESTTWLVLVHQEGGDLDDWRPLNAELAQEEWNLLALDLPGHGGSEGEWDQTDGPDAVQAGIDYARAHGAGSVTVVAAGAGAMWALEAAARGLADPGRGLADCMVLISPGPIGDADPDRIRGDGMSKTILSGAFAPGNEDSVTLLQASIGWTVAVRFPSDASGTALLAGPHRVNVADKIAAFVREQSTLPGPGELRARST